MGNIFYKQSPILTPSLGFAPSLGHPLSRGLVACYLFNEGGGTQLNSVLQIGTGGSISGATWANKQKGSCLNFAGSPQYVDLGNPDALNFGDQVPYSFEFILKASAAGNNNQEILSKDTITGDQRIHFFLSAGVLKRFSGFTGPTVDTNWQHIVYTYSPTGVNTGVETFYSNGIQFATQTGAVPAWQSSPNYALGRSNFGAGVFYFTGDIALFRAYRVALTASEAQALAINPYAPILFGGQIGSDTVPAVLSADQGSFMLSGQAAGLVRNILTADQGSFTLSGQDAALSKSILMSADQGSFMLSGQAATLARNLALVGAQGSFTLTGQDAALSRTRSLAANQGSFALNGQVATLSRTQKLFADQGSFVFSGQAVSFAEGVGLAATKGSFLLTGQAATLRWSRDPSPAAEIKLDTVAPSGIISGTDSVNLE